MLQSLPLSVCSKHNFKESPTKMLLRSHDTCDQNLMMALNLFEIKNKILPIACSDLFDDPCYGFFFQILLLPLPTLFRNTDLLGIPQRCCKCKIVKRCRCLEKKLAVSQNVKHRVTTGSSHSVSRYALKRNENISPHKNW